MNSIQSNRHYRKESEESFIALALGPAVVKDNPRQTYRFEIHTYFGDADAYETINLFIPYEDYQLALEFANFLKHQLSVAYPNGRGGGDEYSYANSPQVPDWNKWFGDGITFDYSLDTYVTADSVLFADMWPMNCDYGEASFDFAKAFYYNPHGEEFEVDFVSPETL